MQGANGAYPFASSTSTDPEVATRPASPGCALERAPSPMQQPGNQSFRTVQHTRLGSRIRWPCLARGPISSKAAVHGGNSRLSFSIDTVELLRVPSAWLSQVCPVDSRVPRHQPQRHLRDRITPTPTRTKRQCIACTRGGPPSVDSENDPTNDPTRTNREHQARWNDTNKKTLGPINCQ